MRNVTSAEPMATEGGVVPTTASTNSRQPWGPDDRLPRENPRWRWNAREKRWNVSFLGYHWTIGKAEEDHVWFLADIHRVNLFTQLTRRSQ
jgi:hypothetical protein